MECMFIDVFCFYRWLHPGSYSQFSLLTNQEDVIDSFISIWMTTGFFFSKKTIDMSTVDVELSSPDFPRVWSSDFLRFYTCNLNYLLFLTIDIETASWGKIFISRIGNWMYSNHTKQLRNILEKKIRDQNVRY